MCWTSILSVDGVRYIDDGFSLQNRLQLEKQDSCASLRNRSGRVCLDENHCDIVCLFFQGISFCLIDGPWCFRTTSKDQGLNTKLADKVTTPTSQAFSSYKLHQFLMMLSAKRLQRHCHTCRSAILCCISIFLFFSEQSLFY